MSGGTLHQLFEDRVRTEPDRTAVITDRTRLTYQQLDARANRLARHLAETVRLPTGHLVAIRTLRTPDVLVAVLAVLKAGGAYAVVGPDQKAHPVVADARAVITHQRHLARIDDGNDRPVITLDGDAAAIGAHSGEPFDEPPATGWRAGVLLTAGTTGVRRPVGISHERLRAAYDAWAEVYQLDAEGRVLVTAAPDTTEFAAGWIRVLGSGATLVLSRREAFTVADTDPLTVARLLDDARNVSGLRLVAVGGEQLRLDEQVRLERRLAPGARLINVYGPTEVAGCGTWFETGQLGGPVNYPERHAYLGRPFPGCKAQVRKGQIWLTPPGGGDAVPTGDLGRQEGEGPLEFRGRMAHRVKVAGRTVDTYRVEAALAGHPRVGEAVVGEDGGRLIAYVLPAPRSASPGAEALRSHLTGVVPAADIPRTVVPITSLPRNSAGKVDRKALVRPPIRSATSRSAGSKGGGVPLTAEDRVVAGWAMAFPVAIMSFFFTDTIWPGSTDLSLVPDPWAWFFRGLYVAESLAFAAGVGFLIGGRRLMPSLGRPKGLTTAAHLAIVYLLASWWPQDNLYRLAAKQDWPRQAALVYTFNVPLMIAAGVVATWAVWGALKSDPEDQK
ncbi:AMP-binding protein [Streptomyces sp. NBC_01481]|uniref:AMP-binding protein n=1 Tax=Streptomyces sp. NBC_01481 TaxID=2975869 RepID=UPI002254FA55|nr:AMP-binding protein [Streptomyces sp. NBC_01481]MCX4585075.1 AMP-binding protein [Streptomyces sp. NBC_01481]